jgi:hypothetical protein
MVNRRRIALRLSKSRQGGAFLRPVGKRPFSSEILNRLLTLDFRAEKSTVSSESSSIRRSPTKWLERRRGNPTFFETRHITN